MRVGLAMQRQLLETHECQEFEEDFTFNTTKEIVAVDIP